MNSLQQNFTVNYNYDIYFTKNVFNRSNPLLTNIVNKNSEGPQKLLIVIDEGVYKSTPGLLDSIESYVQFHQEEIVMVCPPVIIPGGEEAKNNTAYFQRVMDAVNTYHVCRHSYVIAIGGGAVLDLVGFVSAVAHRGVRHIRIPTTVLSQNDSGIGVKNGINSYGKKNFLGTFCPPFAVINDSLFLQTLDKRDWISGMSEAIKVALIKDPDFFYEIKQGTQDVLDRKDEPMGQIIFHCAKLHLEHIASKDPFEKGSSRPLDFGHWAAHKIEQLSNFTIRHGDAVAIGIALDSTYSMLNGHLAENKWEEIIETLLAYGFNVYVPEMKSHIDDSGHSLHFLKGLDEFREHLGGRLTIMLLKDIGKGFEVHEINHDLMKASIAILENCNKMKVTVTT